MKNEEIDKLVFLTIIAGRKEKDALLSAISESGVQITNTIYGKGTVNATYLQNILGLVPEENKVVLTCLLTNSQSDTVLHILTEQFHFDKPNTGIAFTVPVNRLSF